MQFSNYRISHRLGFSLCLWFGLFVLMGLVAYRGLADVSDAGLEMQEHEAQIALMAKEMHTNILMLRRYEKDIFLHVASDEKRIEYIDQWQRQLERTKADLSVLGELFARHYPDDLKYYQSTLPYLDAYVNGFKDVTSQIMLGKIRTTREASEALDAYKSKIIALEEVAGRLEERGQQLMIEQGGRVKKFETDTIKSILLILLSALILGSLLNIAISRSIIRPLNESVRVAKVFASGDLSERLDLKSRDELKVLADTLNDMAERLRDLQNHLESRVIARTEELQAVNEELIASQGELKVNLQEIMKLNEELQNAQAALIKSEKMAGIGTLAAGVAHEINNPLAAIIGWADKMIDDVRLKRSDDERLIASLKKIADSGWRCSKIVTALKSYARGEAFDMQPQSVVEIVDTALDMVRPQLHVSNIETFVELDENMPYIECDKAKIEQVIINLVINARDAMPSGGRVTLRGHVDGDTAVLEVADTGTGIPNEIRQKIFDPFFTTKEVGSGTGLGLAISLGIIERHGGSIELESDEGKGTSMKVILPLTQSRVQGAVGESFQDKSGRYDDSVGPLGYTGI